MTIYLYGAQSASEDSAAYYDAYRQMERLARVMPSADLTSLAMALYGGIAHADMIWFAANR